MVWRKKIVFASIVFLIGRSAGLQAMKERSPSSKEQSVHVLTAEEKACAKKLIDTIHFDYSNEEFEYLLNHSPRYGWHWINPILCTNILGYACLAGDNEYTVDTWIAQDSLSNQNIPDNLIKIQVQWYRPLHLLCSSILISEGTALDIARKLIQAGVDPVVYGARSPHLTFSTKVKPAIFDPVTTPRHLPALMAHFRGWHKLAKYLDKQGRLNAKCDEPITYTFPKNMFLF